MTEAVAVKEILEEISELRDAISRLERKAELRIKDEEARAILLTVVQEAKRKGNSMNVISLHNETGLPIAQINRVMDRLEKEGMVREDES